MKAHIIKRIGITSLILAVGVGLIAFRANAQDEVDEELLFSMHNVTDEEGMYPDEEILPGQWAQEKTAYAPNEVLASFKEGADPWKVLQESEVEAVSIDRVHPIKPLVAKHKSALLKKKELEKDSEGWYWFKGKQYKEVMGISDEELFKDAYKELPPLKQSLYRDYKITLAEGVSAEGAVERLKANPRVEYAYLNYLRSVNAADNSRNQWALTKIKAKQAWNTTEGNPNIAIAIIDTGVDYNHEDFFNDENGNGIVDPGEQDNIWLNLNDPIGDANGDGDPDDDNNGYDDDCIGYDFVDVPTQYLHLVAAGEDGENADNNPMDFNGHGTHCAGIVAAVKDNNIGVKGVAPNCKIMILRAGFQTTSGSGALFDSHIEQAIKYATDMGAKVISMSFGGSSLGAYENELRDAYADDIVLVAAAGNNNSSTPNYPAAMDEVVSVAATHANDVLAYFSNYGDWVDVAAPGGTIISTLPNNNYRRLSGTSMACPYVAGSAALLLSVHPDWTPLQIRHALRETTDSIRPQPLSKHRHKNHYAGTGRINVSTLVNLSGASNAEISLSAPNVNLQGENVHVEGSVVDADFASGNIYYGEGYYPSQWTLVDSVTPDGGGNYSANFATAIPDGTYCLKVETEDSAGTTAQAIRVFTIQNIQVSTPLDNDIYRAGAAVEIRGEFLGPWESYEVEYRAGNVGQWISIDLPGGGLPPLAGDLIATWNIPSITEPESYNLKITLNFPGSESQCIIEEVYVDPTLKEGWPQVLEFDDNRWIGYLTPLVADIDGDGYKEILVHVKDAGTTGQGGTSLHAFSHSGSSFTGNWPIRVADGASHYKDLVVGNIDGTSLTKEIVVYDVANGTLDAFNSSGDPLTGWPVNLQQYRGTGLIADLDFDGENEIIARVHQNLEVKVGIFEPDGTSLYEWGSDITAYSYCWLNILPAVGDFDDDPDLEIVLVDGEEDIGTGTVGVFNMDGSSANAAFWPVTIDQPILYSPAVGDINNDGELEIVLATKGGIYILNQRGDVLSQSYTNARCYSSPALADFDGDGDLEIVACISRQGTGCYLGMPGRIVVMHHDGTEAAGWPQVFHTSGSWLRYPIMTYSPVIGDVSGDGIADIVFAYANRIHAWEFNGSTIDGFPKVAEDDVRAAIIADIDNDGFVEIISAANTNYDNVTKDPKYKGSLYVWDIPCAYDADTMHWPMHGRDIQHTCHYVAPGESINAQPVADAGADQQLANTGTVNLSAAQSYDPDGGDLTYLWEFQSVPEVSQAAFANNTAMETTFVLDALGNYYIRLTVEDDRGKTDYDEVVITATAAEQGLNTTSDDEVTRQGQATQVPQSGPGGGGVDTPTSTPPTTGPETGGPGGGGVGTTTPMTTNTPSVTNTTGTPTSQAVTPYRIIVVSPPAVPSDVEATSAAEEGVSLTWNDNSHNEKGFRIYRQDGYKQRGRERWGEAVAIGRAGANATSYSDSNVEPRAKYRYFIKAYNSKGESRESETVDVTAE